MSEQTISYSVSLLDSTMHLLSVEMRIPKAKENLELRLPRWIPGSYMIRDFSRHILNIQVKNTRDEVLPLKKHSTSEWQVENAEGEIVISYQVYAFDFSVRGAHFDAEHAFFNGTSVFLEAVNLQTNYMVQIEQPHAASQSHWKVTTSMNELNVNSEGFGSYRAKDYDELIDHPFEIADFDRECFDVNGIPHELVVVGKHDGDLNRIAKDLAVICKTQIEFFKELPSCVNKYIFMVHVRTNAYGGLEHRSSTALHASYKDLPKKKHRSEIDTDEPADPEVKNRCKTQKISDDYLNFLTLCSHEYFHTWNIKQIKPAKFLPYDLTQEVSTQLLWVFEGFTSYYEDRMLLKCGLIDQNRYLKLIEKVMTSVLRGKGQLSQSVADSSFDAWTRFYKQDENAPNVIASYYTKGKLVALCLDVFMRQQSNEEKCLDDLMFVLWQQYGKIQKGVGEFEIESILKAQFNIDANDFLAKYVYGCEPLPIEDDLAIYGVSTEWKSPVSYALTSKSKTDVEVNLGALVVEDSLGAKVRTVFFGSNAHHAGLITGDIILAFNGKKVTHTQIEKVVSECQEGDNVSIHLFRNDQLVHLSHQLIKADKNKAFLSLDISKINENHWI